MTRDLQSLHGAEAASDNVELHVLARCYRNRSGLPATLFVAGRNVTPAEYLESLTTGGKGTCPAEVVGLLDFVPHHASVATVARLMLDKLRATGQIVDTTAKPVPISTRDDVEALGQLARCYRAERPVPATVRVGGAPISTTLFLDGFVHDRRECPSSIASDVGVMNSPASMREVAASLHGRLKQAGAL